MVFACQKDSFRKEFDSCVVSCSPVKFDKVTNGKKEKLDCYEVVLEDTILFPEGGGQPCDHGTINGIPVVQVYRRDEEAVHIVEKPIGTGDHVKQILDWDRRLDHMQQHSGQHLITALAESILGYSTTSWALGDDLSHVELDTQTLTQDEVDKLETIVNEKIRLALPVSVSVHEVGDPALDETRTRGLPKDHKGSVRIITIETIEANMCCGTHVSNLSQLQMVKLLGIEKGKKCKMNLQFLVGNRVLKRLDKIYRRELEFNLLLKCNPDSHKEMIEKIISSNKTNAKALQTVLKEFATHEISKFKSLSPKPKFLAHHKKEAEMDYINFFIREFDDPEVLLVLAVGEKDGQIMLHGPEESVAKFGPKASDILDGKGNGKGKRYQAKVKNLNKLDELVKLIDESMKITD